jgi:hypothetical protein
MAEIIIRLAFREVDGIFFTDRVFQTMAVQANLRCYQHFISLHKLDN